MLSILNLSEAENQEEQSSIISDSAAEKALSFQKNALSILPLNLELVHQRQVVLFDKKMESLLSDSQLLGRWGQKQCEIFLKRKSYKTLTKNFSCRSGEIDLIMTAKDGTVVFVEVKTRKNENFADAEAAITSTKKERMKKAANLFVKKYKLDDKPLRFDVVIIMADEKAKAQMRHYENAF